MKLINSTSIGFLILTIFSISCKKHDDNDELESPIIFRVATFSAGIYDITQNPARIDTFNIVFDQNSSNTDIIYSRLRPGVQQFNLLARKKLQSGTAEVYIYADLWGIAVGSTPINQGFFTEACYYLNPNINTEPYEVTQTVLRITKVEPTPFQIKGRTAQYISGEYGGEMSTFGGESIIINTKFTDILVLNTI